MTPHRAVHTPEFLYKTVQIDNIQPFLQKVNGISDL